MCQNKHITWILIPILTLHFSVKLCQIQSHSNRIFFFFCNTNRNCLDMKLNICIEIEISNTWRPTKTQSPDTRRKVSTRCLDDILLLCLSYALDMLLGLGATTFERQTLHSNAPFLCIFSNQTGPAAPRTAPARDIYYSIPVTCKWFPALHTPVSRHLKFKTSKLINVTRLTSRNN